MPDEKYYAILTNAGIELEARALAQGRGVVLTHIAVGDANGQYVLPEADATGLVHEVWRKGIDSRSVSADDPQITLLHALIPASEGGFWIRELGVYGHLEGETEETLYAYANHAPYYKMLPESGQTVSHEVVIPVVASSNADITIVVSDLGYVAKSEFLDLLARLERADARAIGFCDAIVRLSDRLTRHELALPDNF